MRAVTSYTPLVPSLIAPSPIGPLTITSNGKVITEVRFGKHTKETTTKDKILKQCKKELQQYFSEKWTTFTVPVAPEGTDFQKKIWKQMLRVPFGKTISYGELAKHAGRPKAIRAAASACGKNPIVILIPCHRIIASNGTLGGYSGGVRIKKWLLEHEERW